MGFIFIRAKITPSTQDEFHQLSGGLRAKKEPLKWYYESLYLRLILLTQPTCQKK
jgi:hypothetical protein